MAFGLIQVAVTHPSLQFMAESVPFATWQQMPKSRKTSSLRDGLFDIPENVACTHTSKQIVQREDLTLTEADLLHIREVVRINIGAQSYKGGNQDREGFSGSMRDTPPPSRYLKSSIPISPPPSRYAKSTLSKGQS